MDRAQITETLDKLLELNKTAVGLQKEFYAIKKLIRETQESLDFNDVDFCYKDAIFSFDDGGYLCNIRCAESLDEILAKQTEASE